MRVEHVVGVLGVAVRPPGELLHGEESVRHHAKENSPRRLGLQESAVSRELLVEHALLQQHAEQPRAGPVEALGNDALDRTELQALDGDGEVDLIDPRRRRGKKVRLADGGTRGGRERGEDAAHTVFT